MYCLSKTQFSLAESSDVPVPLCCYSLHPQLGVREESVEFEDTDLSMLDDNHNLHANSFGELIQPQTAMNVMTTGQNDLSLTNGDQGGTEFNDPNISPLPTAR